MPRKGSAKKTSPKKGTASATRKTPHFPVVGIGASAGGLEALDELFQNMPVDTGMAFVVVTHQHPGHASLLPELLGRETRMPVSIAEDGTRLEPNHEALEQELQYLKESHQSTLEELETSNEELQSTNEELQSTNEEMQSTNEEMQSTNEEMETSKEEMQSLNEELSTVNAELQSKVEDLSQANSDMQNLLNSTDIATIFLDDDLNIKRYTEQARNIVMLRKNDIGRPIGELSFNLKYQHLVRDCTEVLDTLVPRKKEVESTEGIWYLMRILPYRMADKVIDGLVLTFVNIQDLKDAQRTSEQRFFFEAVFDTVRHPLIVLDPEQTIVSANRCFCETFRLQPGKVKGQPLREVDNGAWDLPELRELFEEILPGTPSFENFKVSHNFPGVGPKVLLLNARILDFNTALPGMILLAMEGVTQPNRVQSTT